jgi:hypothetical protein
MSKKIRTIEQFSDEVDQIKQWRKKELALMKGQIEGSRESMSKQKVNLRAGHLLLYAHWEGWIKEISKLYLRYINSQRITYSKINSIFLASALKSDILEFQESGKSNIHIDFVNKLSEVYSSNKRVTIKEDLIQTYSNLSYDILKDILLRLDIKDIMDRENLELYETYINKELVGRRNSIAHGEYIDDYDMQAYEEMHDFVINTLDNISTEIVNRVINEGYIKV